MVGVEHGGLDLTGLNATKDEFEDDATQGDADADPLGGGEAELDAAEGVDRFDAD